MKLHLVVLALIQQAICGQQVMDSAQLQVSLQSDHLRAWIQSIAAKHEISEDAVRANVQAITYHLDPQTKDPVSKDGEHTKLERRQPEEKAYPEIYMGEDRNDGMTNRRILTYHIMCRSRLAMPEGSRYTPAANVESFWRAISAGCRWDEKVRIRCKLPAEFGPPGWDPNKRVRELELTCSLEEECRRFSAFNFSWRSSVGWASCVKIEQTPKIGATNNVPSFGGKVDCPLKPGTSGQWDLYGLAADGKNIDWTLFTGMQNEQLRFSRSPDFMSGKFVAWRNKDPDYEPWLKFARLGEPP